MSKKNKKKLKQLLRAQMEASRHAVERGEQIPAVIKSERTEKNFHEAKHSAAPSATHTSFIYPAKHEETVKKDEFAVIKKDIRFSLMLISLVLISFALIYYFDSQYNFLIKYANLIFQLVQ